MAAGLGAVVVLLICPAFTAIRQNRATPRLIQAVMVLDERRVRELLAEGANPNAVMQSSSFTLPELLPVVCYGGRPRDHGTTILMYAALHRDERLVRALLEGGGNIYDTAHGKTALMFALDGGSHANVALLTAYGSDVNYSSQWTTPLMEVVSEAPDPEALAFLLAHGADPNGHPRESSDTALMFAAYHNRLEQIPVLLQAGAKVNTRTASGDTALMWAADAGNAGAVALLIEAGADPTIRNKRRKTAAEMAIQHGHPQIVPLLHSVSGNRGVR